MAGGFSHIRTALGETVRSVRNVVTSMGLVATVACLPSFLITAASAQSIATQWQGAYSYTDKRPPVPFSLQLQQNQGSIRGRTTEPATFGNGSSANLYANIAGVVSGSSISFTKTYDGTGGVSHSVSYSGSISADGRTMSGTWRIGNLSGPFQATAVSPAAVECIAAAKQFRQTDGWTYWDFQNRCDSDRVVAICVIGSNGATSPRAVTVPARGSAALNLGLSAAPAQIKGGYREGPLGTGLDPCH